MENAGRISSHAQKATSDEEISHGFDKKILREIFAKRACKKSFQFGVCVCVCARVCEKK